MSSTQQRRSLAAPAWIGAMLALLFGWSLSWSSESPPRSIEAADRPTAAVDPLVPLPSRSAGPVHASVRPPTHSRPTPAGVSATSASQLEEEEPAADAGYVEGSAQTLERASLEQVVDRFENEQPDERATHSSRAEVAGMIADLSIAGGIEQLSCRATVCSARLHFASLDEALRLEADGTDPSRVKWLSIVDDEPGRLLVDVYWPRISW